MNAHPSKNRLRKTAGFRWVMSAGSRIIVATDDGGQRYVCKVEKGEAAHTLDFGGANKLAARATSAKHFIELVDATKGV